MNSFVRPAAAAAAHPQFAPVLLPKTDFQAKPSPKKEADQVAAWSAAGHHRQVHEGCAGRPLFVLHDGPPYANGKCHMGHALNKTLKDMVVRSQRMVGKDAVLVPGWDCHGLPVEWKVEEEFRAAGRQKKDVPVLEFRKACRDYAMGWVGVQMDEFKRLGVLADWDNPYLTLSAEADAATVSELHRLLLNGRLYQALRPVLWSVPEQTALADAEVEYKEVRYTSLLVRFPLAKSSLTELDRLEGVSLVCWTTTPWTLPGNKAVAVAPGARYGAYLVSAVGEGSRLVPGEALVLSVDLAETVLRKAGAATWDQVAEFSGAALAGSACHHPLAHLGYRDLSPVLSANFVSVETGTGLVHVAPGLGPEDYRLGLEHGLKVEPTVDADGRYSTNVPHFAGAAVMLEDGKSGPAEELVLGELVAAGATVSSWSGRHDVAHSWRSKAPLLYRATPQWFVSMDGVDGNLRDMAVKALEKVTFHPPESKARLVSMLETRPDWCVSRQRYWGVPLGLFVHKSTGEVQKDPAVLARVRAYFATETSDAWFSRPSSDFLGPEYDPADYVMVMDVLDVWFESGATHSWVVEGRHGGEVVADLYSEGSDQHRGWFQSSLLESVATRGRAPFKAIRTHGFLLSKDGKKMAKSGSNGVDPLKEVEEYGADALRLWVASANTYEDVRYAPETMKLHAEALRRYRNTLRFLLGNLGDAETACRPDILEEPERWMLAKLSEMNGYLRDAVERYDFSSMHSLLQRFCSEDLSAVYFSMRKDSLYCDRLNSSRRQGVVYVLDQVFEHLVRWLAPLVPLSAEEAWLARHGDGSVHVQTWTLVAPPADLPVLLTRWRQAMDVRAAVMCVLDQAQQEGKVGATLEASADVVLPAERHVNLLGFDFAGLTGLASVKVSEGPAGSAVSVVVHASAGEKCVRCRSVFDELAQHDPNLCGRCMEA